MNMDVLIFYFLYNSLTLRPRNILSDLHSPFACKLIERIAD